MKKTIQQLFLLLFVLLQCVAPLAHAHIGANDAEQHAHIQLLGTHADHGIAISVRDVHTGDKLQNRDSPSIGTQKGFRLDDRQALSAVADPVPSVIRLEAGTSACLYYHASGAPVISAAHLTPHAHAPPALA